jgi:hypothetical protein
LFSSGSYPEPQQNRGVHILNPREVIFLEVRERYACTPVATFKL